MGRLKRKHHYFVWRYKVKKVLDEIDGDYGPMDTADPYYESAIEIRPSGEYRYLDLRVPYNELSSPRTLDEFLLLRLRFYIEAYFTYLNEKRTIKMLKEYMDVSEEEVLNMVSRFRNKAWRG